MKPFEGLLRNLTSGRSAGSLIARVIPAEYLYPKNSWRDLELDGLTYRLDLSNLVDHSAFWNLSDNGDDHLRSLINANDTIVDIGANIGIRSMRFSRSAHKGKVVSFEPHPKTFKRLTEHIAINNITNIVPLNMGIGASVSIERLYEVVADNAGMNRIVTAGKDMSEFPYAEIHLTTLAPALEQLGITKVDMIKVDVEGYEHAAIAGCLPIIERDHPVLYIELDDDNLRENGSSALGLVNDLLSLGYYIKVSDTLGLLPNDLSHCHLDILCTADRTERS